ncbi:MAG TPA: hypothetical protein VNA21_14680 [Steroidobacteraceae bacterium]|nr:hypothetical protein [Steroidobacteraceae bacterium]
MAERDQLAAAAEQFRSSGLLGKPGSLSRLFDFLLARSLAGEAPKELEIALEVFGKSPTFDVSQDAVVRVYVHKLRRRLDDFYARPGASSNGRLAILKGEYRLVFEPPQVAEPVAAAEFASPIARPSPKRSPWLPVLTLIAGIGIGALLVAFVLHSDTDADLRSIRSSAVWAPLLDDDLPITIVVGDYYLLGETDSNGSVRRLVREFFINSHSDFLDHAELDPQLMQKYRNLNLTYLPIASAFALQDIAPVIGRNKRVNVTLTSQLDVSVLKTSHVIYVGFISGLGMLGDSVFAASRVSPGGSFDELVDSKTNTTYLSTAMPARGGGDSSYRDYGYFSSFDGPAGNRVLIIAGTRDAGVQQIAEAVSRRESLDELTTKAAKASSFESLYEIYGVGQASIKAKLLFVNELRNVNVWDPRE